MPLIALNQAMSLRLEIFMSISYFLPFLSELRLGIWHQHFIALYMSFLYEAFVLLYDLRMSLCDTGCICSAIIINRSSSVSPIGRPLPAQVCDRTKIKKH